MIRSGYRFDISSTRPRIASLASYFDEM